MDKTFWASHCILTLVNRVSNKKGERRQVNDTQTRDFPSVQLPSNTSRQFYLGWARTAPPKLQTSHKPGIVLSRVPISRSAARLKSLRSHKLQITPTALIFGSHLGVTLGWNTVFGIPIPLASLAPTTGHWKLRGKFGSQSVQAAPFSLKDSLTGCHKTRT